MKRTFPRYLAFVLAFLAVWGALGIFLWTRPAVQIYIASAWLEPEMFRTRREFWPLASFLPLMIFAFFLLERLIWRKNFLFRPRERGKHAVLCAFLILFIGSIISDRVASQIASHIEAGDHPRTDLAFFRSAEQMAYYDAIFPNARMLGAGVLLILMFLLVILISLSRCWNETRQAGDVAQDSDVQK